MTDNALSRILHVDDEPDIREVARLALEEVGGFTVESCSSGAQAIKKAPTFSPDVILLDVMMPSMSGPEVLKALRALPETSEIPVIFMTAKVQAREIEALTELGAIGVIEKPFDPMMMSGQVTQIWDRHAVR
jgi:CheY-like chemotaxis protein